MNHFFTTSVKRRRSHRGLVSVAMLIGLLIVGLVAGSLLKVAAGRRVLARIAETQCQAAALADSGLDRAVTRLAAHPDYAGEVWEVPAAELGGRGPGRISIEVKPVADNPDRRLVLVVADYLLKVPGPARESRTLVVTPSSVAR